MVPIGVFFVKETYLNMQNIFRVFLVFFIFFPLVLNAQEDPFEDLLTEKITNQNPVYKPVLGIGSGVFNFHGDVRNNYVNPVIGDFGYRFNVRTYLDTKRYYKLNLSFIYGEISGNQRSLTDPAENLNFRTDLVIFGAGIEYSFNQILKKKHFVLPYISFGIENIQFTPKGDIYDENKSPYFYWTDGTIRDISQVFEDTEISHILHRDYNYETDLRKMERDLGLGNYNKNTIAVPLDLGLNFKITERVSCKLGTTLHFTFSDYIDNVSSTGTSVVGKKGNDIFSYNYFILDFDLFSEPKTQIIEKYFAELDFDEVLYGDEDGDFILDAVDDCPGTPYNVAVDTLGCPLDDDKDGIPNYLDDELFSAPDAWVDDKGVTITEEEYLKRLLERSEAMSRELVKDYFETIGKGYVPKKVAEIPDKFKPLDKDSDGEISFEELLMAIDDYFDYKLEFTVEDIYELNNFFFNQ
jgi:hypothetical protein